MSEDDDEDQIRRYRHAHARGGWRAVIRLADAARDAREKQIIDRVERYLEQVIRDSGEENPVLTVREVRARMFEIPQ